MDALRPEFAHVEIFSHMLHHEDAAERLKEYAHTHKEAWSPSCCGISFRRVANGSIDVFVF